MGRLRILLVLLALLAAALPAGAAEPWDYLRPWQALQDRMARGDGKARQAVARMSAYLDRLFFSMPAETWKKRPNAEALFIYVLSGGNPRTIDRLLKDKVETGIPSGALAGAAAYARGRNGLAWRLLGELKDEDMGLNARTQLMLVKASLRASVKPREAMRMLALVRLWKPGTLAEEAALRRGLLLAGREEDEGAFVRIASAYLRRFRHSLYASDFLRVLARFSVRLEVQARPFIIERLSHELALLSRRERALFHAAVARGALIDGKRRLALMAAQRALDLYPEVEDFSIRMRLWMAAAQVARPRPEDILRRLRELDESRLPPDDRRIRKAALTVGEAIIREPALSGEALAGGGPGKGGASSAGEDLPVLVRARAAVAGVEKLLGEKRP